jgi:cytochrome c nitrite reductase small subunit
MGGFPDVVRARPESRAIVEGQCRHCHADMVEAMTRQGGTSCIRCHESVGHLR